MTSIRRPSSSAPCFPRYPAPSRCEPKRPNSDRCNQKNDRYQDWKQDTRTRPGSSCNRPSKPCSHDDLCEYKTKLKHCPSRELHGRYETCRRQERECHGRGDKIGASNCRLKADCCREAIECRRGELVDCRTRVRGMNDRQLTEYTSGIEDQLRNPRADSRRGPLCELAQICRREQHQRLCANHFPGTKPHCGTQTRGEEGRSLEELVKCLLERSGRYQGAMDGVEVRPLEGRDALQGMERDLMQLLQQLGQAAA